RRGPRANEAAGQAGGLTARELLRAKWFGPRGSADKALPGPSSIESASRLVPPAATVRHSPYQRTTPWVPTHNNARRGHAGARWPQPPFFTPPTCTVPLAAPRLQQVPSGNRPDELGRQPWGELMVKQFG